VRLKAPFDQYTSRICCLPREAQLVQPDDGGCTDATALDILLSAIPGKAIVVEGYSGDRQDGSTVYHIKGEKVDWRWHLKNPERD